MMTPSRRRFFLGAAATLVAAPSIVRVSSLMPLSVPRRYPVTFDGIRFINIGSREVRISVWGVIQPEHIGEWHVTVAENAHFDFRGLLDGPIT